MSIYYIEKPQAFINSGLRLYLTVLASHGVIHRTAFPTVPVTVEYSLTEKGEDLKEVITMMYLWGEKWIGQN